MELISKQAVIDVLKERQTFYAERNEGRQMFAIANAIEDIQALPSVNTLDRDTPKAPVLKDGDSLVHISKADGTGEFRSSKWLHWTCPVCGAFVGELYVYEGVRHIQRNTPYCAQCGQKIDWDTPRKEIGRQEGN